MTNNKNEIKWFKSPVPGLHVLCTGLCPAYYNAVIDQIENMEDDNLNIHSIDIGWNWQTIKHKINHVKLNNKEVNDYLKEQNPDIFVVNEIEDSNDLMTAYKLSNQCHTIVGINLDNSADFLNMIRKIDRKILLNVRRVDVLKNVGNSSSIVGATTINESIIMNMNFW